MHFELQSVVFISCISEPGTVLGSIKVCDLNWMILTCITLQKWYKWKEWGNKRQMKSESPLPPHSLFLHNTPHLWGCSLHLLCWTPVTRFARHSSSSTNFDVTCPPPQTGHGRGCADGHKPKPWESYLRAPLLPPSGASWHTPNQ